MANCNQNNDYSVNSPESYLNTLNHEFSCSELGSYSIDAQGNFYNNDKRELRSLIPNDDIDSKYGSDMRVGFDPSEKDGRPLDSLLYWIVLNKDTISRTGNGQRKRLDAEFVFTVGTMRRLLATVFDTHGKYKQPWKMNAIKYNGTIYISSVKVFTKTVETPAKETKLGCRNRDEELKMISFMGLKFEELISKLEPGKSQGKPADRKVDGRQGFYSVRRGRFGGRHLVLTRAQVDFAENGKYVECKLCPNYTDEDEWKFPMYKLRNWWYHMFAANMEQVIYGIRDGPTLKEVSRITLDEIPYQVNNPKMQCSYEIQLALKSWKPMASVGFVDDFFQWLKGVVVEDSYGMDRGRAVQYDLEWKKDKSFIGSSRKEVRMSNFVLPDWYIREMSAFFG